MKEMKTYDRAAEQFYQKFKFENTPLNSWDFYAVSYDLLCAYLKDFKTIKELADKNRWRYKVDNNQNIKKDTIVVITDPTLKIVFASESIYGMNGYKPFEVVGNSPRMFQGKQTCQKTARRIRNSIRNQKPFEETVLNYRKDGSTYSCWIKGEPIFNHLNEVVNFIAYEKEVA